jgi:hypothetical protein
VIVWEKGGITDEFVAIVNDKSTTAAAGLYLDAPVA